MPLELIQHLTQFGVAGLMGILWVWERRMSRQREAQLNEAHHRMIHEHHELNALIKLVRQNTRAMVRFDQTQMQLKELLEKMNDEIQRKAA